MKIQNLVSKRISLVTLFSLGIIIGLFIALNFKSVRYTVYLPSKIVDIKPSDAYQNILTDPEKHILIDVRSLSEYKNAHASSSVNLPIHYLYDDTHGLNNEKGVPLPRNTDTEIYLICTGGRLAGVAYSYLEHYGYRNIKRIEGGLSNWNSEGLPVIAEQVFKMNQTEAEFQLDKPYAQE